MLVEQAIKKRKSCRAFLDQDIDQELIRSIIAQASRAPSNGNLQPWQIYILTGKSLENLKIKTKNFIDQKMPMQTPEYDVYPKPLKPIYDDRRKEIGEHLYKIIGVPREDKKRRRQQFARNALMFNAPVGMFVYIDRSLGFGQWMDLGMYLQNVMLLCEARGLASCAQGYWTFFHRIVRESTNAPEDLMLACGLALGFEDKDAKINTLHSPSTGLNDFAIFI